MKRVTICACFMGAVGFVVASGVTHAQEKPPEKPSGATDVQITGHVVKPVELRPTDDVVKQNLKVPAGFTIRKIGEGLGNTRMLCVSPQDGRIYVTRREQGDVLLLRDTNNDGMIDQSVAVARRPQMHGIAIHGGKMYLATVNDIYVADIKADGTLGELSRIIANLPDGGQHPNRTIAVGPDQKLYISVGSTCNACDETDPESATLLQASLDGKTRMIFASGLRNTIGFGWHPATRQLWGMDHGIDWLGDNEQKEELNQIVKGKQYGWPYIYADGKENPQDRPPGATTMADWKKMSTEPVQLYTAHSAPMQMAFYSGTAFPAEYRGNAFVAMRGSWNRKPPSGYEVARVKFDDKGNAVGIEPFATGWLVDQGDQDWGHLGRLAGIAVAKDGSLLVSDDKHGVIYRISYEAARAQN